MAANAGAKPPSREPGEQLAAADQPTVSSDGLALAAAKTLQPEQILALIGIDMIQQLQSSDGTMHDAMEMAGGWGGGKSPPEQPP
jgi:hypothetical protein